MISFSVDEPERTERMLERVGLAMFAESLGWVEDLVTYPAVKTRGSTPAGVRKKPGIFETLLHLPAGVEGADDLIADFDQALVFGCGRDARIG